MTRVSIKITIVMVMVALVGSSTLLSAPMMNVSAQENMTDTDQNMTNIDQNITATSFGTVSGAARFG